MLSDEAFKVIQAEWQVAVEDIIAGKPDKFMPSRLPKHDRSQLTANEIIDAVCQETGVSAADLMGRGKRQIWCRARHMMIYIANDVFPEVSSIELGRMFNREPSTLCNSMRRALRLIEEDSKFRATHKRVMISLGLGPVAQW